MKRIPISTYVKLLCIGAVCFWLYTENTVFIQGVIEDETLTVGDKVRSISYEILGFNQGNVGQPEDIQPLSQPSSTDRDTSQPIQFTEEITKHPNYQKAREVAQRFNEQVDIIELNVAFLNRVNQARQEAGYPPVLLGDYLHHGIQSRVHQLAEYNYLSNQTLHGGDFRSMHPYVESAESRLSENLYELYISAGDIHLETWQNEEILADYLFEAYEASLMRPEVMDYQHQYVYVWLTPTDMNLEETPYVRLVVAVQLDNW